MSKILNIGCGSLNRDKDDINLDINILCKPTVCADAVKLPFKSESFDTVMAIHILEHISDLIPLVDDVWRILKKEGMFLISVPMFPSIKAISDPTHVRYFIPETFEYFSRPDRIPTLKSKWNIVKLNVYEDKDEIVVSLGKVAYA